MPAWQNEQEKQALFEEVALAHLPSLYSGAFRLAGNKVDAEDLVQETFAKAYEAFERFTLGTNARAWLYRIMNNIFLNEVKQGENKRTRPFSVFTGEEVENRATSPDPADIVAANMLDKRLKKALQELPATALGILITVDVGGFSYEEAAAIFDCPVGTVRSRLHRARTTLRLRLTDLATIRKWRIKGRNRVDKCPGLGETLSAYLDGELSEAETKSVGEHLAQCTKCSTELEGLRQVKRFLAPGSALAPALPKDLGDKVRANIYPRQRRFVASANVAVQPATAVAMRAKWLPKISRTWLVAPLLALLLVVGLLAAESLEIGPFAPSPAAAAATASIDDHLVCAQLGHVIGSLPGDASQVSTQLADTLGISIALPQQLPPGFTFAGGRTIRPGNIDVAHIAWSNGQTMISFYEAADPGGSPPSHWTPIKVGERTFWDASSNDEHAVFWRDAGTLYVLVGQVPEEQLLQSALTANPTD